jgi:hypothetical protein
MINKTLILTLSCHLFFASLMLAGTGQAQEKYPGNFDLGLWNSNIVWAGQGYSAYQFTIDGQSVGFTNGIDSITNLVITTNFGDITFKDEIGPSDAGRYATGFLESQEDIETIKIIKAVAAINGKIYDITDTIYARDFTPVKIQEP